LHYDQPVALLLVLVSPVQEYRDGCAVGAGRQLPIVASAGRVHGGVPIGMLGLRADAD